MTLWLIDLESVESRYTSQWKTELPKMLQKHGHTVRIVSGGETPQATTPGAFLNFGGTNVYKSKQLEIIAEAFCRGEVEQGDYFLYTDAWNPTVIQLKYMAELLGVDIRIGGMWHAGSYDPADFLGRLIGDKPWVRNAERSMYECFDHNFFASQFHIDMFFEAFPDLDRSRAVRTGWPMEYMINTLAPYKNMTKRNLILFPHRIAPEKQIDIFRDLKQHLPQYEFAVSQEQQLTKNEYHNQLGEAKLVFSANLQETLGISWYEGVIVDTIPMVPNRLSYTEMALDEFKYPSEWTSSFQAYETHRQSLIDKIIDYIENYDNYILAMRKQADLLTKNYFSANKLYEAIKK